MRNKYALIKASTSFQHNELCHGNIYCVLRIVKGDGQHTPAFARMPFSSPSDAVICHWSTKFKRFLAEPRPGKRMFCFFLSPCLCVAASECCTQQMTHHSFVARYRIDRERQQNNCFDMFLSLPVSLLLCLRRSLECTTYWYFICRIRSTSTLQMSGRVPLMLYATTVYPRTMF